jgi:hypothetical protein
MKFSPEVVHDVLNHEEMTIPATLTSTHPIPMNANPHGHAVTFVADADQAAAFGFIPEYQITAEQLFDDAGLTPTISKLKTVVLHSITLFTTAL